MRTLYLRNVPDDVLAQLECLARGAGMSVSAFAVRELTGVARRALNPALLASLPDLRVHPTGVLADLDDARRQG